MPCTPPPTPPAGPDTPPKVYLLSWAELLPVLGLHNDRTTRRQVRRLNDFYAGPIRCLSKGGQPKCDRAKLLLWWDGLDDVWAGLEARRRDRVATVAARYRHGRAATIVPDIAGRVLPAKRVS